VRPSADFVAPETLGFESGSEGWWKTVGARRLLFTRLHSRLDLEKTERLQHTVFGVSDRDLASSSILVTVHETGGEVLGAFHGERLVGFVSGWGGYVDGRARIVSDLMAVEAGYRGGIGFALKELQAVVAFQAGFDEIVWTVDPLRAANARLNFERLGAHARKYLRNVYGEHFGAGLYGGLPSDRLLITWPLRSARFGSRLLGRYEPLEPGALSSLPEYAPGASASRARLTVPGDFDALLASDPARAREWRFRLRHNLEAAFASGYALTGFAGRRGEPHGYYLLSCTENDCFRDLSSLIVVDHSKALT
jgi:predicted GNAT superfamily acetyltransferase